MAAAAAGPSIPGVGDVWDGSDRASRRTRIVIAVATALVVLLGVALALGSFVVSTYTMQGSSMAPTFGTGDRVWINRLASPERGDVVVIEVRALDGREVLKRVVATGGDIVEIDSCELLVNGSRAERPTPAAGISQCGGDFGPVAVPEGHVFVLGDDLAASQDSRQFGTLPEPAVVGVAFGS